MVLTNERAEMLANYLMGDSDRAKELLAKSPEDAMKEINADGNDFTVDEIVAFGEQVKSVMANANEKGELAESALDNVSGGLAFSIGAAFAIGTFAWQVGWSMADRHGW